ncbi:nitroreductase family protein [Prolixibacteraceae bacterium JC049]|nr:nitroreductase family protein [Prolixibacteraceae bacterium JC049]
MQDKNRSELFSEIVEHRRAVRDFDTTHSMPENIVEQAMNDALLAPSSSNLQLWEMHRVKSDGVKEKLAHLCMGQGAAKTASELVVVVTRKDKWKERAKWNAEKIRSSLNGEEPNEKIKGALAYYEKLMPFAYFNDPLNITGFFKYLLLNTIGLFRPTVRRLGHTEGRIVAHKSAALAAQTFMLSVAASGYDTCPMEGVDPVRIKRLLKLPTGAEVNMVIAVGKRTSQGVYGPRLRVEANQVIQTW